MSFSARLYFVRHAPVINPDNIIYGADIDVDLTHKALFHKAAGELQHTNNPLWVSSPFERTFKTAQTLQNIMEQKESPLVLSPDFQEQSWGDFEGRPNSDLKRTPEGDHYLKDPMRNRLPQAESILDLIERVHRGIHSLMHRMKEQDKQDAIIVCHGGTIRAAHILSQGLEGKTAHHFLSHRAEYLSVHKMSFTNGHHVRLG